MLRFEGLTMILGGYGVGKTLTGTALALHYKHNLHMQVYSNFGLNIPHTTIRCLRDLKRAEDGLLLLDEAYTVADARRAQKKENIAVNEIASHARKRNFDVVMIAQIPRRVDVGLRELASRILIPKITARTNGGTPTQLLWTIYEHPENPMEKKREWYEKDYIPITITQKLLDSYDTHAPIYDYTADTFTAGLGKGIEFEKEIVEYLTPRCQEVIHHEGRNNSHKGVFDITAIKPNGGERIEIDAVGSDLRYIYTQKKNMEKLRGALIVYENNGSLWGIRVNNKTKQTLRSNARTRIDKVKPLSKPLDEIFPMI